MKNESLAVAAGLLVFAGCASGDSGAQPGAGMGGSPPTMSSGINMDPMAAGIGAPPAGSGGSAGTGAPVAGASMNSGGMGPAAGTMAGTAGAGMAGTMAEPDVPDAGPMVTADSGAPMGSGMCCADGDCLCHGDPPSGPTSMAGPFDTDSYDLRTAGCIYYPTDAEPPFAGVAISDGFVGTGGCGALAQTSGWGPLYASWGIVAMIIHTGGGDQPQTRGMKLTAGIAAFKEENENSGSMLFGKMSGRYGTSGFSMGGGGTTYAAKNDPTLRSNVAIMAWTPTGPLEVPSLFIFGSADGLAGTMGMSSYRQVNAGVPKMAVTVNSGHAGQPSSGGGKSGEAGLAFQKVFLEGDERWIPVLKMVSTTDSADLP